MKYVVSIRSHFNLRKLRRVAKIQTVEMLRENTDISQYHKYLQQMLKALLESALSGHLLHHQGPVLVYTFLPLLLLFLPEVAN